MDGYHHQPARGPRLRAGSCFIFAQRVCRLQAQDRMSQGRARSLTRAAVTTTTTATAAAAQTAAPFAILRVQSVLQSVAFIVCAVTLCDHAVAAAATRRRLVAVVTVTLTFVYTPPASSVVAGCSRY